jgi:hypothetical protein
MTECRETGPECTISEQLISWLQLQCPDMQPFGPRLLGLDVSNGVVETNHQTSLRANAGNVIVVMSLIKHLLATVAY